MRWIRRLAIPTVLGLLPVAALAPSSAAGAPTCFGETANVVGTEGADAIDLRGGSHGSGPFVVATLGGADLVIGSEGADIVCLGDGDDRFEGGGGADRAAGGPGDDALYGDGGHDELRGNGGDDHLEGGPGHDLLLGGSGRDFLDGGAGNDDLRGRGGRDELRGQSGDDVLRGNVADDLLTGGPGDDVLKGGRGDDKLNGGDSSSADSGVDRLWGGRGFDRLWSDWSYYDGDADSVLRGGKDYDYCALGAEQHGCERDYPYSLTDDAAEWRPLVTEVFARWGLDEEACGTMDNGEPHCVGPQIDQALEIIMCESKGYPFAVNGTSGTTGLFQHRPEFFEGRVDNIEALGHAMPDDPNLFDPEVNIMLAAYLVWRSRQVQIGEIPYDYAHPASSEPYYTSNYAKGPDPWGHWLGCGIYRGLYDPGWLHPAYFGD